MHRLHDKYKDLEIRTQIHLMDAEGCTDDKPNLFEIMEYMNYLGWQVKNMDYWFDGSQGFWRWTCDLVGKINTKKNEQNNSN